MPQPNSMVSLEDIYGSLPIPDDAFEAAVMRSLNPRDSTMLYEALAELGLGQEHKLLDIGGRDAAHACEIVRSSGCRVLSVDLVRYRLQLGQQRIIEGGLGNRVAIAEGRIEAVPAGSRAFDFIWCRDMIGHVGDLAAAFAECYRVLRPGGRMVLYATFATDLLEPREAARLCRSLAVVEANLSADYVESQWQAAGLQTILKDEIGSEWREYWEESGRRTTSTQLLKIAHLRRDRERLIRDIGAVDYEVELADCHWGVYQMLGKLCPTLFVLQRPLV